MKTINLKTLIPVDYNPRKITPKELQRLSNNLNEFGLVDPIIINLKNNHIIGGHQRYFAIKKQYPENVELNLITLGDIGWAFFDENLKIKNEDYEKALNISLNKLSGEWDTYKLATLLDDIENSGLNNDLSGFKPSEFELYSDENDEDIEFDPVLFAFSMKRAETITCPKCKHEFDEVE